MAVEIINGCQYIHDDKGFPTSWIYFDPRVHGIAANAAGDCYQRLQKLASSVWVSSQSKVMIDIGHVDEGRIQINSNPAIETDFNLTALIKELTEIIASARVV